jgi:hypothetical protein
VGSALTTFAFTPTFATLIASAISSSVVLLPPTLVTSNETDVEVESDVMVKIFRPPVIVSKFCPRASRAGSAPSNSVLMFCPVWANCDADIR